MIRTCNGSISVMLEMRRMGVFARYSNAHVSKSAKRYKRKFRVLEVSIEYLIPGPHKCEGLYSAPDAWPLVPIFGSRY